MAVASTFAGGSPRSPTTASRFNRLPEIYADLSKSNPHFAKLYSSLSAYRNDSLVWMQVAELSFDSFMMRMRTRT